MMRLERRQNLQAYFNDHQAEAAMAHYRWSGALNPTGAADFLLETESNTAASKANHFLERSYDLSLSAAGALLHHRLVVNLQDNAPASGVEGGMQYRCYVRLYVPAGAGNVKLGPVEADHTPNLERPPGLSLVDGWFWIHAEQGQRTWTLTLEYDTPWNQSQASHSLYWQKQPGTGPDRLHVTWSPGAGSFKADGQLSQDQAVLLTGTGVKLQPGQPATAHLPAVTL